METTPHPEETRKKCDFKWGKKMCVSDINNGVQFYESFTYHGINYFLYDCVYLHVNEEPNPYIGKLVKIWELPNKEKRVKVVWFFRPVEVVLYLKDVPQEKEIFLASGKGIGLVDVNDLEVINGKCNVVCTSKDERNPQPCDEKLKRADYIFYRTFDVGKLQISDQMETAIAGIGVKYFFNSKRVQERTIVPRVVNAPGDEVKRMTCNARENEPFLVNKTLSRLGKNVNTNLVKVDKLFNRQIEKKAKVNSVRDLKSFVAKSISVKKNGCSVGPAKPSGKADLHLWVLGRKNNVKTGSNCIKVKSSGSDIRLPDNKRKRTDEFRGQHSEPSGYDVTSPEYKRKCVEDCSKHYMKKVSSFEESVKLFDKEKKEWVQGKGIGIGCQGLEDAKKRVDKSTWFKNYSWEERLQTAYKKESLVLLENLNPSYTSEEVQDIVWQAFKEECSAQVIPRNAYSSAHYGQAFAIFKSKEVAEMVCTKLQNGCLMLEDGRPLSASRGILRKVQEKQPEFMGHLSVDRGFVRRGFEVKAVSTSHFPQPNTSEYDMAIDWIFLQRQSNISWNELHEKQREELDYLKSQLKCKESSAVEV